MTTLTVHAEFTPHTLDGQPAGGTSRFAYVHVCGTVHVCAEGRTLYVTNVDGVLTVTVTEGYGERETIIQQFPLDVVTVPVTVADINTDQLI